MKLSREKQEEMLRLLLEKERRKYNNNFFEFFKEAWKQVDPWTELKENWHIVYLAWIGQMIVKDIVEGRIPPHKTVLINVPPRSLKSWIFNQALPVWAWTLQPSLPIITASYSEVLALGFSRKSQQIMKTNWFKHLYGDTFSIDQSEGGREAVGETQTNKGGIRLSTGTGGTIVGRGFLLGIVDDPLKPDDAREEKALQRNIDQFWGQSFDTRRNDPQKAVAVVIMQRLAEGDLSGYLIENYSDDPEFLHINLPAVQDGTEKIPYLDQFLKSYPQFKNDIYKRGYLFGERFDESFIRKQQKKGTIFWNTQYQQNPLPTEGLLFKREWFKMIPYKEFYELEKRHKLKRTFITDTAYTSNTLNDPTGILTYTMYGNTIYIIDYEDDYVDSAELPEWIERKVKKTGYDNKKSVITVEPKGSGKVVVSLLKRLTDLNVIEYAYPRQAKVNVNIKKEERAEAIVPMVETGRVVLVEGSWNEKFISQITTFPLAKHDEAVDCLVMGLLRAHYVDSRYKKFALKKAN